MNTASIAHPCFSLDFYIQKGAWDYPYHHPDTELTELRQYLLSCPSYVGLVFISIYACFRLPHEIVGNRFYMST